MNASPVVLSDQYPDVQHFNPSCAVGPQGLWTVWQGYQRGTEQIFARLWDGIALRPPEQVTPAAGLHHSPFVGLLRGVPAAVWIQGDEGAVVGATRLQSGWARPVPVGRRHAAVSLHAAADGRRLWAAWCEPEAPQTYSIWAAAFDGHIWRVPVQVTPADGWVQRPEVAVTPGGCWVVWDTYDGVGFAVQAALVGDDGMTGPPERVSEPPGEGGMVTHDAWQFVPSVCVDAGGAPWAAWLCTQDVVNNDGVINYWPTVRVARRGPTGWAVVRAGGASDAGHERQDGHADCDRGDGAAGADLARLAWGLLSWEGRGVWGYLGRRRKPLIVADPVEGAWLLWERKEIPDGSTPLMRGILCARRLSAGAADGGGTSGGTSVVSETLAVAAGPRWYMPAGITLAQGRRCLWVAGRVAPDISSGDVFAAAYDLDEASALQDEGPWRGWRTTVVREPRPDDRPQVRVGQSDIQLYWGDLHVHAGLSGDADEGYLDEVMAYGRDNAQLDCLAISNNDHHLLSMTQSDYAIYCHYVRHFHQDGRFVVLPAYEWTYRPAPRAAPNHRTVIGRDEALPLLRHTEAAGDPMAALVAHAEAHGALLHLHHERWELTDSPAETNIEVCSGWGVHMLDPQYVRRLHAVLAAGRRLGFVGNSDNHRRNPGLGGALTGIYARALTREAILDALRCHRCFATDGSRIVLRFWIDGTFMGGVATAGKAPEVRWDLACTAPPAMVTLLRDGAAVRTWTVAGDEGAGEYVDTDGGIGQHFYYLAVEQSSPWRHYPSNVAVARGPRAWSSPIWVRRAR